ncbi:serine hydrolase domain-containing protein [Pontibacter toksunensis]|uniref:Serine hydrolase domain-containing protein n=1 Tax=Pontibacter toksunensis TaxID=1332631 RepID=A0ABW6C3L8_9BACT
MKQLKISSFCLIVLLCFVLAPGVRGQEVEENPAPKTINELRRAILKVLQDTGTPAAGIALVDSTGPVWVDGLGLADREEGVKADEETMFRIGSTSKIVVALAILKLQEQGKLNLKDKVRELVPEIEFENPWEETNPILVEHLLEHTTGWDDMHLPELYNDGSEILSLKEALELHPHSRVSRWLPGTRMAYSNTGPNVAAYIIEKVTGQPYEEFIQKNFFAPIGTETMTYFLSEDYKQKGATLYKEGHPSDYGHMIMRASGSINASPKDMAKVMQFFLNRGKVGSNQIISENSLKRMETPLTTLGARAGLSYGYGLCLYTSEHNSFTYYKHGGGVGNGISDFSYLPEFGVGYCVLINSGNPNASRKISTLIRDFQTQHLSLPKKLVAVPSLKALRFINGYYQPINPSTGPIKLPTLTARRVWTENDTLYSQFPAHIGDIEKYVALNNSLYQSVKTKKAELIFVNDPLAGEVFELANVANGTVTFATIPGAFFFARILLFILWLLFVTLAFLLLPVWVFRYWRGKISGGANIFIRIWPLLPIVFLISAFVLLAGGTMNGTASLAKPTFISVSIMIATIAFLASAFNSVIMAFRYRNKGIKRSVFLPAACLSGLHLLVAFFLLWHGLIGLRTWA